MILWTEKKIDEIKEQDWRSLVRRYPMGCVLGALAAGYWIGRRFNSPEDNKGSSETRGDVSLMPYAQSLTPSVHDDLSSQVRRDVYPIPNTEAPPLSSLFIKKTSEFLVSALAAKTSEFLADVITKKMSEVADGLKPPSYPDSQQ